MSGTLARKRIVVTRAVEQSREFVARLEEMGATVLLFPAVSFSETCDAAVLDRAIRSLGEFGWILFTSANAVRFFSRRCRKLGIEPKQDGSYRCAAVGPATATAVAAEGFPVDHVAQEFLGAALASELSASVAGMKVLLPRSDRARPDLPDALKAAGVEVTEVVAYQTGGVGLIEPEVMRAIQEDRVDVISFFSPSAVENMRAELGGAVFDRVARNAVLAAVGPVTASVLRSAGFSVAVVAPLNTAESMARAIENYFSPGTDSKAGAV
jgi:uroporphyrinogen-III synthase